MISGIVVVLLVIGSVIGLVAYNSGSKTPAAAATNGCDYTASPSENTGGKAPGLPPDTKATGTHTATLVLKQGTYTGTVVITLDPKAPCTVNSFTYLASKKFFDGTTCHRETASDSLAVLQCGDPTGTGSGGPGYTIPDENLTGAKYGAGVVAMANTGDAHTGGSQFFINYKDSTGLDASPTYTPFGTVTSGMDVLAKIAAVGQDNSNGDGDGKPKVPVTITSFTIS
jgi:peptidyl-prolyl cis-trans isomerase B (cyclophilin B)